jgi:hypothetical protein
MNRFLSVLSLFVIVSLAGCAEPVAGADVRQAQAARFQAMIDVDVDTLDTLLSDTLTYTHSTGTLDTKTQLIESLQSQTIRYLSIIPSDIQVRLYDDTAIITAVTAIRVQVGGQDIEASLRVTEIHKLTGEGWKLLAYQSTRMPEQQ